MSLRTVYSVTLFIIYIINIKAQIPNNSFEQWENGDPVGWSTFSFLTTNITQSSDAHSGSSSVRGDVVDSGFGTVVPILISGIVGGHGFPVSQRYANLTGYYKLSVVDTTENISVVIIMFKDGQGMAAGGSQFFKSSSYTKFTAPIYYSNENIPDSCQISISLGNRPGLIANVGSYFIIDDLAFEGIITDIGEDFNNPNNFSLEQNYPNPFNPSTKIRYTIPSNVKSETTKVILKVYDVLGNEIAELVNEFQPAGNYEVNFIASGLTSGMYFYTLTAGSFTETKKMILLR